VLARELIGGEPVTILVVCDGVSKSNASDQAAALAAQTVSSALLLQLRSAGAVTAPSGDELISRAIEEAHVVLCNEAPPLVEGLDPPGTTVVAAFAAKGRIAVGWVGDSRAYWLTPSGAGLLTHDHSWVNQVVDSGEMSEADALQAPLAHALTHCLGALEQQEGGSAPEPSVATFEPAGPCRLILCSDGLWNYAPEAGALAGLVHSFPAEVDALGIARGLVDYALDCGGQDNVTAAVAFVDDQPPLGVND